MSVFAAGGLVGAFPIIESETVVVGPVACPRTVIRCAPRVCISESLSEWVKPVESEILKLRLVSEEEVPHVSNVGSDSLIVVDNDGMVGLSDNCKERGNLLCIILKFFLSVGKNKGDCLCVNPKHLQPVSQVSDLLGCFSHSVLELYSSDELNFSVIVGDSIHP